LSAAAQSLASKPRLAVGSEEAVEAMGFLGRGMAGTRVPNGLVGSQSRQGRRKLV
jgi:hypothetical protein